MCVSYRRLNQITLPFEYPIPRCDDAIDNFDDSAGRLFFIALDNRTKYQHITGRYSNKEKLTCFAPDDEKWCFDMMPFGPRDAPCMKGIFESK